MSLSHGETFFKKELRKQAVEPTHSYKEGQVVPVLEHTGCSGAEGEVQNGVITCTKCGKVVNPDNQEFAHQRLAAR